MDAELQKKKDDCKVIKGFLTAWRGGSAPLTPVYKANYHVSYIRLTYVNTGELGRRGTLREE